MLSVINGLTEGLVAGVGEAQQHHKRNKHHNLPSDAHDDIAAVLARRALADELFSDEWVVAQFGRGVDDELPSLPWRG